jgi:hypothetical protein
MKLWLAAVTLLLTAPTAFAAHNSITLTPDNADDAVFSTFPWNWNISPVVNANGFSMEGTAYCGWMQWMAVGRSVELPLHYPSVTSTALGMRNFVTRCDWVDASASMDINAYSIMRLGDWDIAGGIQGEANTPLAPGYCSVDYSGGGTAEAPTTGTSVCLREEWTNNPGAERSVNFYTMFRQRPTADPSGRADCDPAVRVTNCVFEYQVGQRLYLPTGWSMVSSYIIQDDMNIDQVFADAAERITMMKNNNGSVWMTEFGFNGIGEMLIGQGYQIKLHHPQGQALDLYGRRADAETPIELVEGWNLVGYLRTVHADALAAFAPLIDEDHLVIAKNYNGQVLIPEFSFNGIGNLEPGKGYQVKTTQATTFSYLPDNQDYL